MPDGKVSNTFTNALETTTAHEGTARVQEPTGDFSVKGIRQNVYDKWTKQKGLPRKGVGTLSNKERGEYVRDEYVLRPKLNELPQEIFDITFDFAFNSGPETAISVLQQMVGAKADGIIGPNTKAKITSAMQKMGVEAFRSAYLDARQQYLSGLEGLNEYQDGLKTRVDSFREE